MNSHFTAKTDPAHKPVTFQGDLAALPAIFDRYKDRKVWIGWKWEFKGDKWTKPPCRPGGAPGGSTTEPSTWSTYYDAVADWKAGKVEGIGLCLYGLDDGLVALDLDNARVTLTGALAPWAKAIVDDCNSYAEISVSGEGLRVIGTARGEFKIRSFKNLTPDGGGVEIFPAGEGRYITVSGKQLPGVWPNAGDITDTVNRLVANKGHLAPQQPELQPAKPSISERAMAARPGRIAEMLNALPQEERLQRLIADGVPEGQRSEQFFHACGIAKRLEWTQGRLEEEMRANPAGIAQKYLTGSDRLAKQIAECWGKVEDRAEGGDRSEARQDGHGGPAGVFKVPSWDDLVTTADEWRKAKLTPRCIVRDYLYADLSVVAAAGSTGKTTITLFEDACIALQRDMWGLKVESPGRTLFVTAEDQREYLVARQREICAAMGLTEDEKEAVRRKCVFWDVTAEQVKLTMAQDGNLLLTGWTDAIIKTYKNDPPAIITFDPLISFGCSEAMVNDNEQRLVEAARRLIKTLGCCVRYIHHTGKANGRAKTVDQYSSRGGSALPDGARMVTVLVPVDTDNDIESDSAKLPSNVALEDGEQAILLRRAKLSYAPRQPDIFIIRDGYAFRHAGPDPRSKVEKERASMDQIVNFLRHKKAEGIFLSKSDLYNNWSKTFSMPRKQLREIVGRMLNSKMLFEAPHPAPRGAKTHYLSVDLIQPEGEGARPN